MERERETQAVLRDANGRSLGKRRRDSATKDTRARGRSPAVLAAERLAKVEAAFVRILAATGMPWPYGQKEVLSSQLLTTYLCPRALNCHLQSIIKFFLSGEC